MSGQGAAARRSHLLKPGDFWLPGPGPDWQIIACPQRPKGPALWRPSSWSGYDLPEHLGWSARSSLPLSERPPTPASVWCWLWFWVNDHRCGVWAFGASAVECRQCPGECCHVRWLVSAAAGSRLESPLRVGQELFVVIGQPFQGLGALLRALGSFPELRFSSWADKSRGGTGESPGSSFGNWWFAGDSSTAQVVSHLVRHLGDPRGSRGVGASSWPRWCGQRSTVRSRGALRLRVWSHIGSRDSSMGVIVRIADSACGLVLVPGRKGLCQVAVWCGGRVWQTCHFRCSRAGPSGQN